MQTAATKKLDKSAADCRYRLQQADRRGFDWKQTGNGIFTPPPVPDFVGCQTHNAAPFHCETIRLKCSFEPHLVVWNNVFLTNTCCASGMLSSHRIKTFPINLTVGFIVMCKCGTDDEVSPDRFQSEEGFISREATQRSSGVF